MDSRFRENTLANYIAGAGVYGDVDRPTRQQNGLNANIPLLDLATP